MASGAIDRARTGRWINEWNPKDKGFWEESGKRVARRNLVFSIFAEFLGFSVWQLFSMVAALLPLIGYGFTAPQLFSLVALPPLVGATMRFQYTFAIGLFGGATRRSSAPCCCSRPRSCSASSSRTPRRRTGSPRSRRR